MKLIGIIVAVIVLGAVLGYGMIVALPGTQKEVLNMTDTNEQTSQPTPKSEGLEIEDISVGEGREVKSGDTVVMHYSGTLTDGTKFDSSYDRGQPFQTQIGVGQVIKGWDEGVPGMKIGGKRRLTIPPELGYGSADMGTIPPDSTLIFEVELVDIK